MARPTKEKKYILEKRAELIWALSLQDYNGQDIGTIFNISRTVVNRIIAKMPKDWKSKWIKTQ